MADIFDLTDAWNDAGTTFTSIKMDVADTASAADSKLIDLQVGAVSAFSVRKDGAITLAGEILRKAVGSIVAAGMTQESATPIAADIVRITGGAGGVVLPPAKAGRQITIFNNTSNAILVYPASGENFAGITQMPANAAGHMLGGATATVSCAEDGVWSAPGLWQGQSFNGVFGLGGMVTNGSGAADSTSMLIDPKGLGRLAVTDSVLGLGGVGVWHLGNLLTNVNASQGGRYIRINGVLQSYVESTSSHDLAVKLNADGTFRTTVRFTAVSDQVNSLLLTGGATENPALIQSEGSDTDIDIRLAPKGDGLVSFGAHTAIDGETVTGYVEIKDAAGNLRKLAVVS